MTYRPEAVTQRDGSHPQNSNCLMAAAAVGLDYHTLGAKTSTGERMRKLSGDTAGGTNSDEIVRAWDRGYDEVALIRDGQPWSKVISDLKEGRLVMLQWWAATVGDVCVSGSGAYGHGVSVAPETRMASGQREWLVADPWCKPPRWSWVREDKMRAGAEEWYRRMRRNAGGSDPSLAAIVAAALAHMGRYQPGGIEDPSEAPGATGPAGILFASTRPHPDKEMGDVSINTSGKNVTATGRVDIQGEAGFYADAGLTQKYGTITGGSRVLIGPALDSNAFAIIVETSKPYTDGDKRPTVVYVSKDKCGDPYNVEPPDTDCVDEVEAAVKERDGEWRAWLDSKTADAPDR